MPTHQAIARDPFTGVQMRVGVMGSAGEPVEPTVAAVSRRLGRAIAERGCCLLTGACPGLPHEAVLGAKELDGHIVGISPAATLREHVETFGSPYREYEVLIFTGLGLVGRELVNIRSSDIVVVMGGRSGTLGEFAIAYEEGKLIVVLSGNRRHHGRVAPHGDGPPQGDRGRGDLRPRSSPTRGPAPRPVPVPGVRVPVPAGRAPG